MFNINLLNLLTKYKIYSNKNKIQMTQLDPSSKYFDINLLWNLGYSKYYSYSNIFFLFGYKHLN